MSKKNLQQQAHTFINNHGVLLVGIFAVASLLLMLQAASPFDDFTGQLVAPPGDTGPPGGTTEPDYAWDAITFSTTTPRPGDAVTVTAIVKNIGTGAGTPTLSVQKTGGTLDTLPTAQLLAPAGQPGDRQVITLQFTAATAGTYTLTFTATGDANLANKDGVGSITFTTPPTGPAPPSSEVEYSTSQTIPPADFEYANVLSVDTDSGNVVSTYNFISRQLIQTYKDPAVFVPDLDLSTHGTYLYVMPKGSKVPNNPPSENYDAITGDICVQALSRGYESTRDVAYTGSKHETCFITPGGKYGKIGIVNGNVIKLQTWRPSVQTPPTAPEFTWTPVTFTPSAPTAGTEVTVTADILNTGTGPGTFTADVQTSGTVVSSTTFPTTPLAAGGRFPVTLRVRYDTAGTYPLTFTVTSAEDSNPNNNVRQASLIVVPQVQPPGTPFLAKEADLIALLRQANVMLGVITTGLTPAEDVYKDIIARTIKTGRDAITAADRLINDPNKQYLDTTVARQQKAQLDQLITTLVATQTSLSTEAAKPVVSGLTEQQYGAAYQALDTIMTKADTDMQPVLDVANTLSLEVERLKQIPPPSTADSARLAAERAAREQALATKQSFLERIATRIGALLTYIARLLGLGG